MTAMIDFGPTTRRMANLLEGVTDDLLAAPTPCPAYTLGDLVEHVDGLSRAFAAAAVKDIEGESVQSPSGDAARLGADWRTRIPRQLEQLAAAWRDTRAWEGMTRAGGIDLPAEVAGKVALNELVIHGWDIARASGQPYDCDPPALDASLEFVSLMSVPGEEAGREGLFGPVVDVPEGAPLLDRVIGLSGRDPLWAAG
ncbi:TIGR03086 family metal-binding protein [Streptomyces sp. NPDC002055]|uniref:TIGR03086 family metal-binding protein n=1 Tax=Streptomyces sp. NPDC002055 TaxID=3154534 RepID=UPI00332436A2